MRGDGNTEILSNYMPAEAAQIISGWINHYHCEFKITKNRNSKFGDYRPPYQGKGHRISVNHTLNPYAFLVTTVHEFAHLVTFNQWKNKVKPHGQEWKDTFKRMMLPFFALNILPRDVESALAKYLKNPAASSCSDANLFITLKKYDQEKKSDNVLISEIPENHNFQISTGRVFKKLAKNRTRYRCIEINTGKIYLFSPLAEVLPLSG
ncbi:sprT domain-containing protein [Pseudopedobacter beijingensis]|uniref:SprT domain-containing protein n=1 Tax=Pseudopedobacter beijingensis TaxID=1207056 RepID=A0ABW4I9J8_9SPHI